MNNLVDDLDRIIINYADCEAYNVASVLLSRFTLLMTMQPGIGKELVKYVWEQLDIIEQADPNNML